MALASNPDRRLFLSIALRHCHILVEVDALLTSLDMPSVSASSTSLRLTALPAPQRLCWSKRGRKLSRSIRPESTYTYCYFRRELTLQFPRPAQTD